MLNKKTFKLVKEETKRFLSKLNKFEKAMEISSHWEKYGTPNNPCMEASELKRSSMDLTRALAEMRRRERAVSSETLPESDSRKVSPKGEII